MAERLVVFSRYPEPGTTKTRLIPALGAAGAARLQREMAEHTLRHARELRARRGVDIEVRFAGGDEARMSDWLGPDLACAPQGDGDLGQRMSRAFRDATLAGVGRAVIVGTDCPELSTATLDEAFDALSEHDLVLGPASDGGYYLIGLGREAPRLFEGVDWGTGSVLERTLAIAGSLALSVRQLATLDDVDRPEDLPVWERARRGAALARRIAVVIPALNEAENIQAALDSTQPAVDVQVIVADGGSTDGSADVARSWGAEVLAAPPGRAAQANAGAVAARAGILLFLHADTRLPEAYDRHVRDALARRGVVAGAFTFRVDAPLRRLRVVEWLANFRSRRLHMPYGDQGLFLASALFGELGGFPDQPIMEDFELVRRLKRRGRIAIVAAAAVTSARRWLERGVFRVTLVNQAIIAAYLLGVSPERIGRWYGRRRGARVPPTG